MKAIEELQRALIFRSAPTAYMNVGRLLGRAPGQSVWPSITSFIKESRFSSMTNLILDPEKEGKHKALLLSPSG
jgi:hypothetical protein